MGKMTVSIDSTVNVARTTCLTIVVRAISATMTDDVLLATMRVVVVVEILSSVMHSVNIRKMVARLANPAIAEPETSAVLRSG